METSSSRHEIYLDNATTSYPKPDVVYHAIQAFARSCGASPGRGGYPRALAAEDRVFRCRETIARVLGVRDATRIAFASSSTEALNWALKGLLLVPGDHAVVTVLEHNSVLRPLRAMERTRGIRWSVVRCDGEGFVDPSAVEAAICPTTRLVCAVHASNVLGTIQPVEEIARVAHAHGVPLLVDGSQTAGALPLAVEAMGIDLFAFTGHKSLLGPPGTGGLYVRPGLEFQTWKEGETGHHSEDLDPPGEMPARLEAGTPNAWGLAGLLAGVESLLVEGLALVREREARHAAALANGMRAINGVTVYGPRSTDRKVGIVSIGVRKLAPEVVGRLLWERFGVAVRTGLHCSPLAHRILGTATTGGTVRFGIGPFTTDEDVRAAVEAVGEIREAAIRSTVVA